MRIRSKYFLDAEKCKMISNINLRYSVDKTNKHKETKKKKNHGDMQILLKKQIFAAC